MIFKFPFFLQDEMWSWYFSSIWSHWWHNTHGLPTSTFFFFLKLFLLMCFSARKNDIRKNTLCGLWKGQKWKPQSEIFFMKKVGLLYLFGGKKAIQCFLFVLATLHLMRDLSSLARDWTLAILQWKHSLNFWNTWEVPPPCLETFYI